jgi:uncharacterized membrane protein YidH (DUF202 family)
MTPETKAILILLFTATIWAVGFYKLMKWLNLRWERKKTKQWIVVSVSIMIAIICVSVILNLLITAFDIIYFSHF